MNSREIFLQTTTLRHIDIYCNTYWTYTVYRIFQACTTVGETTYVSHLELTNRNVLNDAIHSMLSDLTEVLWYNFIFFFAFTVNIHWKQHTWCVFFFGSNLIKLYGRGLYLSIEWLQNWKKKLLSYFTIIFNGRLD